MNGEVKDYMLDEPELFNFEEWENEQWDKADDELEKIKESWKINNLGTADWAFEQLQRTDEEFKERTEYAEKQIEKYQTFVKREKETAENKKTFLKLKLEEYLKQRRNEDPKFILKTAQGSANYRKSKKWDYGDEKELINFLKENELTDFVRTKEEVNKSDLKKAVKVMKDGQVVTKDGEIIEDINVIDVETFSLTLK